MIASSRRGGSASLAAILVGLCFCCPALARPAAPVPPWRQLVWLWREIKESKDFDRGIARLEAFAKQHAADLDVAARAHLRIIDCHEHKGDLDAAIAKAKWLAVAFPKARVKRFNVFGDCPRTMAAEFRVWVDKNPIYMKDFAWAKLSELYGKARRWDDQLAAYDHLLTTVPPDPLPDTKNLAIFRGSRMHRDALASKIQLLRRLRRLDDAKEAERLQEKLYPAAAWRERLIACSKARDVYSKESEELIRREREAELKRMREEDEKIQKQREAEEEERRRREEALRARDEKRRRKYLKHKREATSREKPAEPPAKDPPPAPQGPAPPPTTDASAIMTPRMPDREEATPSAARTALSPTPSPGTQRRPAAAPPRAAPTVAAPVVVGLAVVALLAGAAVLFARRHRRHR